MGDINAVLVSEPGLAVVEIVAGDVATLHAIGARRRPMGIDRRPGRPRGGGRRFGVSRQSVHSWVRKYESRAPT
ncbi:hypothetical protein ACWD4L_32675 [Streptomyces sp. NPDC002596]